LGYKLTQVLHNKKFKPSFKKNILLSSQRILNISIQVFVKILEFQPSTGDLEDTTEELLMDGSVIHCHLSLTVVAVC